MIWWLETCKPSLLFKAFNPTVFHKIINDYYYLMSNATLNFHVDGISKMRGNLPPLQIQRETY